MKSTHNALLSICKLGFTILLVALSGRIFSQDHALERLYVRGGMNVNYILQDSLFDENNPRPFFGTGYGISLADGYILNFGLGLQQYGGRSSLNSVYQTLTYAEAPIAIRRVLPGGFQFGAGLSLQSNLNDFSRVTGVHTLLDSNIYGFGPARLHLMANVELEFPITPLINIYGAGSYSVSQFSTEHTKPRFLTASAGVRLNLYGITNLVSKESGKQTEQEALFLSMYQKTIYVVLYDMKPQAEYYATRGDSALAKQIIEDAVIKNDALIEQFSALYKFGTPKFIYSSELAKLRSGEDVKCILSIKENTSTIEPVANGFVCLYPGNVYVNKNAVSREGYYYFDKMGEKLGYPFPSIPKTVNNDLVDVKEVVQRINQQTIRAYYSLQNDAG
ncbi:MAG: hypothetical protein KDC92_00060 [Bacteroidetes bacterium]|nr:hypothetical protein [Bacteroidota bacterium]